MTTLADIWNAPFPDSALPAQRHSPTSRAAAKAAERCAKGDAQAVLQWFEQFGPGTDEQMIDSLMPVMGRGRPSLAPSTLRARRIGLVQAGRLRDSGRKGVTKAGGPAVLWEFVKKEDKDNAGTF